MFHRAYIVCPACEGEGQCETGEWWTEPATGTASPILAECTYCNGEGGVPDPDYDGPEDPYHLIGWEGGVKYS